MPLSSTKLLRALQGSSFAGHHLFCLIQIPGNRFNRNSILEARLVPLPTTAIRSFQAVSLIPAGNLRLTFGAQNLNEAKVNLQNVSKVRLRYHFPKESLVKIENDNLVGEPLFELRSQFGN